MSSVIMRAGDLLTDGKAGEAVRLLDGERSREASPALFTLLGYALLQDNRIAEARDVLADGVARFPLDARLQEARARIRWMVGEGTAFADGFLAAVAQRPGDGEMRVRCADLLRLAGQTDKAEALLRAGLTLDADEIALGAALAMLLDETGRLEEALAQHRDVVQRAPGEPMLRLNLAHTLLRLGRTDAAMLEIAPVRRAAPALQVAITYEGMALKQLGDARYSRLFDYERHVRSFEIETPAGFSSVAEFNTALADYLRGRMDASVHPLEQPLRGGTQTSQNLVDDSSEIVRAYFSAMVEPVRAYIAELGNDRDNPLEAHKAGGFSFSGSWAELLHPGGFHVNHTRPGGWVAAFYDVSLPSDASDVGQEGRIRFGEPRWPVPGCGVERVVQPKAGRLVLFPSYMSFGTVPVSSGERLAAPLDVAPA